MNKSTNILLAIILVLVTLNLALTGVLMINQSDTGNVSDNQLENLDSDLARIWGKKVTEMYNLQDHQALYSLFNEQARVKISQQQLKNSLQKLHRQFGDIEESAFINSIKVGEKGDEKYYYLLFTVRVKETKNQQATLKLTVVKNANTISLYGVRLDAAL